MHQYRPGKFYQYDESMTILKTASASSAVGHLRDVFLLAYHSTPVLGLFSQIANTALLLLNQIRYLGQGHQLLVRPSKLIKSVCLLFGKIGGASYIIIDACVCFRELNSLNMEFIF